MYKNLCIEFSNKKREKKSNVFSSLIKWLIKYIFHCGTEKKSDGNKNELNMILFQFILQLNESLLLFYFEENN